MSHSSIHYCSRRTFVTCVAAAGAALVAGLPSSSGFANAQTSGPSVKQPLTALPHLSPGDPLAKSLGYEEDASKVDKGEFPNYKPGEKCDKCRFFQGTSGQRYGPCQIFVGKAVNADGWCASFNAKT
jgi:hypothetical protein